MHKTLSVVILATLCAIASPAMAQSPTVEGALQTHFGADSDDPAAQVLRKAGYTYERTLVAEMLPSETTLFVEVELARDDTNLRYPLKLARKLDDGEVRWSVDWSPVEDYARGLVAVGKDDALAPINAKTDWTAVERLPAFPVIVGEGVFVTPYGRVATQTQPSDDEAAQLAPPKKLAEHAQRWIGLTLEDEPGTANVDLILSPDVTWQRATTALMAPASFGMFRMYVVGSNDGRPVAFATAAPVLRQAPDGAAPLVVGMYPAGEQNAFKVRIGDEVVAGEDACADAMTFCAKTLADFEQQALDRITAAVTEKQTKLAYVMFATTGDFKASTVANHLIGLGRALGVPTAKIFMGYIGGKQ
jgi:hypothetical protein